MDKNNQEFYELLTSSLSKHTFSVLFTNQKTEQFRPLTTAQLKNLIKTVVDSSLTQLEFSSATLQTIKECYAGATPNIIDELNIIDKILFLIETRIHSISPTITVEESSETVEIKLEDVKKNLLETVANNKDLFLDKDISGDEISLTIGIPSLQTEHQVDQEIYKTAKFDSEDPEQVRKLLGEAFVIELAKSVKQIKIGDKNLDLSSLSFVERQKMVENLPALIIQQVIEYVEKYKSTINKCLVYNEHNLTIDGSLFSLR